LRFGSLQARALGITPAPELLYIAALFHDTGLVAPYRSEDQRFELDGANQARAFLLNHGFSEGDAQTVWTAIALHTTPEIPYKLAPEIAATTAGVETDVLGLHLTNLEAVEIEAVTSAHPRPDFKRQILQAFADGFKHRPDDLRHRQRRRAGALRSRLPAYRLRRHHPELLLARVAVTELQV
jgi:hypothetical protein